MHLVNLKIPRSNLRLNLAEANLTSPTQLPLHLLIKKHIMVTTVKTPTSIHIIKTTKFKPQ